ncbi:MAG: hypothetical protein KAW12_02385 [Candidatus Aminicenantes bacterium]|nr:hypothetical protein [Candidatus Aminicenantes bacterium]
MKVKYEFIFADNHREEFALNLTGSYLHLEPLPVDENDSWVKLGFHQCENCPLDPAEHEYCPVARNLLYVVTRFKDHVSYDPVSTRVSTGSRQIMKNTSLQTGLSSLIGLIMATSGCPVLDKFRPMVFTHLPFSDENETIFRAISVYLLAQYLRAAEGKEADWKLEKFEDMYTRIEEINRAFFKRFRVIKGKDANVNALLILEVFAQIGEFSLSDNWLKSFKPLFTAFLDEQ